MLLCGITKKRGADMRKFFAPLAALVTLSAAALSAPAQATTQVGEILACYACQNTGNSAIDAALATGTGLDVASDGLLFAFVNTSGSAITGGVFSENGTPNDSFALPTLPANSTFIVIPGTSVDGGIHLAGGLFQFNNFVMDTSDGAGGLSNSTVFAFSGSQGALAVTSGNFTPADSMLPMRDTPSVLISFVGQGPNSDSCNNCYFGQIATLTVPSALPGVPEPSTWAMMLLGFAGLSYAGYRKAKGAVLSAA
jgi:hypothetical protein